MIIKARTWMALTSVEKMNLLKTLKKKNPLKTERINQK